MYSNLNLDPQTKAKNSGDSSDNDYNTTQEELKHFIKFVLVGNLQKNVTTSLNTQT